MSKRKVSRPDLPAEIGPRLEQWALELKAECAAYGAAAEPKPARPTVDPDKYGHKKIRETLERMYSGLCCYCEAQIGVTSTQHVEHYRPKGRDEYLAEAYDWENLHQACEECNLTKSDKFDPACPRLFRPPMTCLTTLNMNTMRSSGSTTGRERLTSRPSLPRFRGPSRPAPAAAERVRPAKLDRTKAG